MHWIHLTLDKRIRSRLGDGQVAGEARSREPEEVRWIRCLVQAECSLMLCFVRWMDACGHAASARARGKISGDVGFFGRLAPLADDPAQVAVHLSFSSASFPVFELARPSAALRLLDHPRRCRSGSAGEEESRQARHLRMTPASVRVATARTSIEPSKRGVTTRVIGAADVEARSVSCRRWRTPYVPQMTADTTQGDHVYGNETDFPEVTGRARGVRWSGDEVCPFVLFTVCFLRRDNDPDFPRTTRRARSLKVWYGEWCGRVSIESPWGGRGRMVCALVYPRNSCVGMRCMARESIHEGGMSDAERGGMRLRSRRARAVDDVSDAGDCVVREDGVRMRMYGACVRVGCMGAAWKTENQPRREDARGP
ncbi:hypothetical protein B0H13DRAFT_1924086 [Mycena leptocephala]|nr:hypothetical protein B0H13DRAFT_1924086 [Mycena leptocephala]